MYKKILLVLALFSLTLLFFYYDLNQYTSIDKLQDLLQRIQLWSNNNFLLATLVFCSFILLAPLPPCLLPYHSPYWPVHYMGYGLEHLLFLFASTIGATFAMLISRYIFRDWIERKFSSRLTTINNGIKKEGAMYLFSMRLIPVFPFFLVNYLMGLTRIPVTTYYWVSQIGMLPGTIVYVWLGVGLASITSLSDLVSSKIILAFVAVGLLPWASKFILSLIKKRQVLKPYTAPNQFDYNIIVIGAGAAGLVSSLIGSTVGAKCLLIEKDKMGGDCLNTGCVPSKALIKAASIAHSVRQAKHFGIDAPIQTMDFQKIKTHIQSAITAIEPHDSIERYQSLGVDVINGEAQLITPWSVAVGDKHYTAKRIIIATGARPFVPPTPGLEQTPYLTSDTVWSLNKLPTSITIVGGGAIGCELAQSFARLGAKVTLLEAAERILGPFDEDVSQLMHEILSEEGISIKTSQSIEQVSHEKGTFTLTVNQQGQSANTIQSEALLIAIGRRANTDNIGLKNVPLELNERGQIIVNEHLQTNFPHIYACGDCIEGIQLTHVSGHEAWYATVNSLFGHLKRFKADYRVIPSAVFTSPEIATVGKTKQALDKEGLPYESTRLAMAEVDRAIADGNTKGFIEVFTQQGSDKILGAVVIGAHGADIIAEFSLAMKHGLGLKKILATVHLYPSYQDGAKLTAGAWQKANKPEKLLKWLSWYFKRQVRNE